MIRTLLMALMLALALPVAAAVLVDPPPVPVPQGLSLEQVQKAVVDGMARRHWTVESHGPGEVVAVQSPRSHVAKVKISFDTHNVTISYLDSTNLEYHESDGKREIHRKYNEWVANLSRDIQAELSKATMAKMK